MTAATQPPASAGRTIISWSLVLAIAAGSAYVLWPRSGEAPREDEGPWNPPPAPAIAKAYIPEVTAAEPLMDFPKTVQTLSPENFEMALEVGALLPASKGPRADMSVNLERHAAAWQPGSGRAVRYNQLQHPADGSGLTVTANTIKGSLAITVTTTKKGEEPKVDTITVMLDGTISAPGAAAADSGLQKGEERFWMIQPESQGRVQHIAGTYTATVNGEEVTGPISGLLKLPVRKGHWNMGAAEAGKGLSLAFNMGTTRQNWNHVRVAVHELAKPRDLSAHDGLRVRISTPKPRPDVSVSVWAREADGSWYYVKSAVPLVDANNEATLLFSDFAEAEWVAPGSHMDEDYTFDRSPVTHLAVGVVNPLGVGEVAFTVDALEAVKIAPVDRPPAQVDITGKMLVVNDHQMIPAGLFGGYAGELPQKYRPGCQRHLGGPTMMKQPKPGDTEIFLIDCWFDRYSTAFLLQNVNWAENAAKWGREYAQKAKDANYQAYLEFWNEPYLNWATRPGKNYGIDMYNIDEAREGGPVRVRYKVPEMKDGKPVKGGKTTFVDGPVIPHFIWTRDGDTWKVKDSTQFTYWSARGNEWIYNEMSKVVGKAVKETNPNVQYIVGWGFRWNEDHWAAWDILYKPTIDKNIAWIDGVHEHHYQGDTSAMAGAYEVLTAYGVTAHNKWLYSYNTETNDLIDAPARGIVDTPEKAKAATQYRRMVYNMRDILYLAAQCPDKARARTVIHNSHTPEATEIAYGLMSNLRGRLVQAESSDDNVWAVASIDGTDPQAMPPAGTPPLTYVAFVFNDHREPRDISLAMNLPAGVQASEGAIEIPTVDKTTFALGIDRKPLPVPPGGANGRLTFTLPARTAARITFPLAGTPPKDAQVVRKQFFAPQILQRVARSEAAEATITLDRKAIRSAQRAWLRIVVEDVNRGEATVAVGNYVQPIPAALTADNNNRIFMLPLDIGQLREKTTVTYRASDGNVDGYRVDMTSIVLERDDTPPPAVAAR